MTLLSIDQEKCIKCGICAEVCPRGIIAFKKNSFPGGSDGAEKVCINCGHCLTVCSEAALELERMVVLECDEIEEGLNVTAEEVTQFVKSRRSICAYKEKSVDKDIIEKVIDAARYAPTGMNSQPVHWKVIYAKDKVVELKDLVVEWMKGLVRADDPMAINYNFAAIAAVCTKGKDMILRGAPHVVVTHALKGDPTAGGACTIAVSTLDLVCHGYGLGTCWAGFLDIAIARHPKLKEALELPEGHVSCGSMMIGYPKYKYKRIPTRKEPNISWV